MVTIKSLLNKFTMKIDVVLTAITVTLLVYVVYITGQFGPDALHYILIDAAIVTPLVVIFTTIFRYRRVSAIVAAFNDKGSDAGALKGDIFSHVRMEGIVGCLRMPAGVGVGLLILMFQIDLKPMNLVSIVIALTMISPICFIILYLTAENVFSALLSDRRVSEAVVPPGSFRPLGLTTRILLLIGSIIIIPLGILGFFLYLVNSRQMVLENLGLHILFIALLSAATIIISLFEMAKNTRRSVDSMVAALENMKDGGLSIDAAPMLTTSELGMMSQYVNALLERLRSVIAEIADMSTQLSAVSDQISGMSVSFSENAQSQSASTEEISATVEEISAGMDHSSSGARDQVRMIDTFLSIRQELSAIVQQMRGRVRDMLERSGSISDKAKLGEDSLSQMNASIRKIDQSSGEMTNIVGIITDISEKINLLSLNAAIEAARAGEYGRGFAVVADEISKLADQTATSIKDINRLIKTNDDEIRNGMANVTTTVEMISDIIGSVGEISGMMNTINISMQDQTAITVKENEGMMQVKQRSDEIWTATESQKIAIEEIVRSISTINEVTQETAQGAEEMTASAREMADMAERLKSRVDYFRIVKPERG